MRKVPFLFLLFLPLFCSAAQWDVTTSQELHNALLRAAAGDEIVMSPGTYEGTFFNLNKAFSSRKQRYGYRRRWNGQLLGNQGVRS